MRSLPFSDVLTDHSGHHILLSFVAAVRGRATQEKPFVGTKRIVRHARDYEKDPKCARLRPVKKKSIKTRVDQRIFKGTNDSDGLTRHTVKRHSQRNVHPETASCDPPLNSPFSVQTQKKLPIERINHNALCETNIGLKRPFSPEKGIIIFMASFCARNLVLASVEI
jgi:hypothetical protein